MVWTAEPTAEPKPMPNTLFATPAGVDPDKELTGPPSIYSSPVPKDVLPPPTAEPN